MTETRPRWDETLTRLETETSRPTPKPCPKDISRKPPSACTAVTLSPRLLRNGIVCCCVQRTAQWRMPYYVGLLSIGMTQQFFPFPWWPWPLTPKFEFERNFCTMHLTAKFHHPTFNRSESEVILRTKLTNFQTNRRHWIWKHPPPRRWVGPKYSQYITGVGDNWLSKLNWTLEDRKCYTLWCRNSRWVTEWWNKRFSLPCSIHTSGSVSTRRYQKFWLLCFKYKIYNNSKWTFTILNSRRYMAQTCAYCYQSINNEYAVLLSCHHFLYEVINKRLVTLVKSFTCV